MKYQKMTRRSVLGRIAAGTAAAAVSPLLPVLESTVEAQTEKPKRLLLVYWSGGTSFGSYLPTGTETAWSMSPQMTALEKFKQKITVFANIRRSQDNAHGSHQAGTSGIWTAARMFGPGPKGWVSHPSIDAIINKMVPQPTEVPVLNLDAMSQDPGNLRGNTTYGLDLQP